MDNHRKSYSVAEAKSGLSELLDRVEAGEEILITRRGRPVARVEGAEVARKKQPLPSLQALRAMQPRAKVPITVLIRQIRDAGY